MSNLPGLSLPGAILGFLLLGAAEVLAQTTPEPQAGTTVPPDLEAAEQAAARWLVSQMVPNETVAAPSPDRRRLLLSYRVPREDAAYPFVYGRSFIYDDALGAIALAMLGRYREAEFLLGSLAGLVRPDGSLWFAYNTQNDWPGEKDHDGALVRTGSVAWVGYALTWYLQLRSRDDPGFARTDVIGIRLRQAAEQVARFVTSRQVTDRSDPRFGLVTGGAGASAVVFSKSSSRPEERWDPAVVTWVSMEHNIDAWFFLRDLGRLTSDRGWTGAAGLIGERLMSLWSDKDGQFFQGVHEDRTMDTALPLDGASWGSLFLAARGDAERARRSLGIMEERFGSRFDGYRGYRPYGHEPVYADDQVSGFYFPGGSRRLWSDLPFVWGEGSLGAAAALLRTGSAGPAIDTMRALLPLQEDGGLRYASSAVAYEFASYPSVAATSWFIIATEMLRGSPAGQSFWGP